MLDEWEVRSYTIIPLSQDERVISYIYTHVIHSDGKLIEAHEHSKLEQQRGRLAIIISQQKKKIIPKLMRHKTNSTMISLVGPTMEEKLTSKFFHP